MRICALTHWDRHEARGGPPCSDVAKPPRVPSGKGHFGCYLLDEPPHEWDNDRREQ